jgi:hypothetical protein
VSHVQLLELSAPHADFAEQLAERGDDDLMTDAVRIMPLIRYMAAERITPGQFTTALMSEFPLGFAAATIAHHHHLPGTVGAIALRMLAG